MWKSFRIKIPLAHPDCPSANPAGLPPRGQGRTKAALIRCCRASPSHRWAPDHAQSHAREIKRKRSNKNTNHFTVGWISPGLHSRCSHHLGCSLLPFSWNKSNERSCLYLKTTQVCLHLVLLCSWLYFSSWMKQTSLVTPTWVHCRLCSLQLCSRCPCEVWAARLTGAAHHFTPSFPLSSLFFHVFHNVGLFSARIPVYNPLVLNSPSCLQARSGICRNV